MRIGVDPGVSGALALLDDGLNLIEVVDMPVMAMGKTKRQVNAAELGKILTKWRDWKFFDATILNKVTESSQAIIYLEQVSAFPGQGVTAMFNFGMSYGVLQGVIGALQIPTVLVTPQSWKRRAGLISKPKDMSRTRAQQLYPGADLSLKKHVGRAEAILIAVYGDKK